VPEEITLTAAQPMITFVMAIASDYTEASNSYFQGNPLSIIAQPGLYNNA